MVTSPICLLFPVLADWLDKRANWFADKLEGLVDFARGIVRGLVQFVFHPIEALKTIISFFGGCPEARAFPRHETLIIGHHGYTDEYPENTIQSCSVALDRRANGLEIDLCYTADGEVVLWHDWDPNDPVALARHVSAPDYTTYLPNPPNTLDPWRRPINELTLAEFRKHYSYRRVDGGSIPDGVVTTIPTFRDFVEATASWSNLQLLCLDVKMPGSLAELAATMIDRVVERLPANRGYDLAFSWDVEYPPGIILNPIRYSAIDHAVSPFHNTAASVGRPVLTFAPWRTYRRTIAHDVERWNQVNANPGTENAGRRIDHLIAWTVNDFDELKCLVDMGVSGIITDSPVTLASIVDQA